MLLWVKHYGPTEWCVMGHEAVLPWELKAGSRRIAMQNELTADEYENLMMDELEDLACHRLRALVNVESN